MQTVTISSKFQVVIPGPVRENMGLRPGQKMQVLAHDNRIEPIPVRPIREMRGFLKGIDTGITRGRDRL